MLITILLATHRHNILSSYSHLNLQKNTLKEIKCTNKCIIPDVESTLLKKNRNYDFLKIYHFCVKEISDKNKMCRVTQSFTSLPEVHDNISRKGQSN